MGNYILTPDGELYHYGVKGQKWGVRRYQNKDGSLTKLGKRHKSAAINALRAKRSEEEKNAATMKAYTKLNRESLQTSKTADRKSGEKSWSTQSLSDAYKATGRAYVTSKFNVDVTDALIRDFSSGKIKIGEDYVVKNARKGLITMTDSGNAKVEAIKKRAVDEGATKYAREIKEYWS